MEVTDTYWVIDAENILTSSVARFYNHTSKANANVWFQSSIKNKIYVVAKYNIGKGKELLADYGKIYIKKKFDKL